MHSAFDSSGQSLPVADSDSTECRSYGIDSSYMKRAALYTRVSSDTQKQERTIESQVAELKRQIAVFGDTLVKEYIDDGYMGGQWDRPALDQLRQDLKTNAFERGSISSALTVWLVT